MRAYHQSQPSNSAQQPTPPNTSTGGYYPGGYELSSSSQSPSPLTVHPHTTEYTMTPYMRHSPNNMHGHPSPKDDIPPPSGQYFGSYTVSGGGNEPEVPDSFRGYPDFGNGVLPVASSYIDRGVGGHMTPLHQHIIATSPAGTPILGAPNPLQYHHRMHMPARPGDIEDIGPDNLLTVGHPGQANYNRARTTTNQRRKQRVGQRYAPAKGEAPRPLGEAALRAMEEASQNNDTESLGDGEEPVTLSDKCEDEARFIFETREALVKSGMKGKGMWEEISRKYEEVYGQRLEKATLQMRLTRTFAKHAIWPDKEVSFSSRADTKD